MTPTMGLLMAALALGICGLVRAEEEKPATSQPAAQPVDFRKLKELLPAELAGIKRTEANGEKIKMGEYAVSMAGGQYRQESDKDDAGQIELQIFDYGATQGMVEGMTAWSTLDIDREGDDGYQKSTKVGGFPAFETYEKEGKSGHLQIWVAGRFIVTVNTNNLAPEQISKIGEALALDKLAALK